MADLKAHAGVVDTDNGQPINETWHDNGDGTFSRVIYDQNSGGGGSGGGLSVVDEAAWTAGTSPFTPAGGVFNDAATALTSGQQGSQRVTPNRALHANLRTQAGTEIGTSGSPLRVDPTGTTVQPVSATALPLPTGAAADATLTGGTQKAIARGGAKGTTTAADLTSTASGANHQPLDVAIYDTAGNQISSFGGGTQYADSATQATPTGTAILWKDASNVLHVPSPTQGLPVSIVAGSVGVVLGPGTSLIGQVELTTDGVNVAGTTAHPVAVQQGNLSSSSDSVSAVVTASPKGSKVLTTPSIGTASTLALAANTARKLAILTNPQPVGGATLYLGPTGVTTSTYSVALSPGATYLDGDCSDAWYAVATSAATQCNVTEVA